MCYGICVVFKILSPAIFTFDLFLSIKKKYLHVFLIIFIHVGFDILNMSDFCDKNSAFKFILTLRFWEMKENHFILQLTPTLVIFWQTSCRYVIFLDFLVVTLTSLLTESRYHAYTAKYWDHWFQRDRMVLRVSTIKFEFQNGGWLLFSVFKDVVLSQKVLYLPLLAKEDIKRGGDLKIYLKMCRP